MSAHQTGLWLAGNEGMEKNMETIMMCYILFRVLAGNEGMAKMKTTIMGYIRFRFRV